MLRESEKADTSSATKPFNRVFTAPKNCLPKDIGSFVQTINN
jgi:hypothetical protein